MDTAKTLANAPTLAQRARNIRRNALRMGEVQGQGYIAQALDIADVLAVAYFHAMRFRPEEPSWEDRDRFLLSNGHYAIALYAALIEAGIVPEAELETYGFDESRLPMSGMASYTPGMEMSGGSLGLGLSIAVGMGLGLKRKGSKSQPHRNHRCQQPAGRRALKADDGVRAVGGQAGSLRLVRASGRRQRPRCRRSSLRRSALSSRTAAARNRR